VKITDVTLTLFAWTDIPATTYGRHTGRFSGKSQLGLLTIKTDDGVEGHAFLGSAQRGAHMDGDGDVPERTGNRHPALAIAPYNVYPTTDGFVAIFTASERHWHSIAKVLGREDLLAHPDFASTPGRAARMDEIDAMVGARMARQIILDKDKPPTVWAVLDEGVLRRPVGGPHVMREQLNRLADAARRPNIVIQVIAAGAGAHEGLRGAGFVIAEFTDHPSVAYQDTAVQGQIVDSAADVGSLLVLWDTIKAEALPRAASLDLIEEAAKTWT